jgi:hypothetical protein
MWGHLLQLHVKLFTRRERAREWAREGERERERERARERERERERERKRERGERCKKQRSVSRTTRICIVRHMPYPKDTCILCIDNITPIYL